MLRAHDAYAVAAFPSCGLGLIAARPLRKGQRVRDAPLLRAGRGDVTATLYTQPWAMTHAACCTGDADLLATVQAMARSLRGMPFRVLAWEHSDSVALDAIVDASGLERNAVFRTYSMICSANMRDEAGTAYLLEMGAFMNHACVPNMRVQRDLAFVLVAARDISPGEEITISYVPDVPVEERGLRAALLESLYGFVCTCALCKV